ncbi:MAG: hypothetical protein JKP98_07470 [Rhodobacteraceae bacterium]|nr:hypothetical protein [Paracoccaceae bacterium]MBL4557037.1 hypothetical protein [Paracoccaceae bacterium]
MIDILSRSLRTATLMDREHGAAHGPRPATWRHRARLQAERRAFDPWDVPGGRRN